MFLYLTLSMLPRFCSCSHLYIHITFGAHVRTNLAKVIQKSFGICSEEINRALDLHIYACLLESVESVLISVVSVFMEILTES